MESYYPGPEVMPGATESSDSERLTYSSTKKVGNGSITINANADSMDELHKLLALAGIGKKPEEQNPVHSEPEAQPEEEPEADDCGCSGEDDSVSEPSVMVTKFDNPGYITNKEKLIDIIRSKLQQRLA